MTAMRRCEAKKNMMQKTHQKLTRPSFQRFQRPEVAGSCFESKDPGAEGGSTIS